MARRLPNVLDRSDVAKLMAAPNIRCATGLRNRVALELMYRAGLRVGEVCNLTPRDIRWRSMEISVRHGKGDKDRVVPFGGDLLVWLERWRDRRPENAERFLCTLAGQPLAPRYLQQVVDRCARRAGLDPRSVTPHTLRHCFATECLEDGFTIREVQQLLGHANLQTTQIYTHVRPAELGAKIRARSAQEASKPSDTVSIPADVLDAILARLEALEANHGG